MSEPRVYVDLDLREGETVTLPEGAYHHLVVVLRRIRGDEVTLFNGHGGEYGVTLQSINKRTVVARVEQFRNVARESALGVTLAQAVSKGERMDFTIQKAVELGVTEIQPLVTDHVVVKLNEERWQRKQEHWQSVAVSACEQSGRTRVPRVSLVQDLRVWLTACPADSIKLVLAPGAVPATPLKPKGQNVILLVGPEGGLSDKELELAELCGFARLPLGPRVLRTETAGMVALTVVQSLWGDMGSALTQGT